MDRCLVSIPEALGCQHGDAFELLERMGCTIHEAAGGYRNLALPPGWSLAADDTRTYLCDEQERARVSIGPCLDINGEFAGPPVAIFMPFYHIAVAVRDVRNGNEVRMTVLTGDGQEILRRVLSTHYEMGSIEWYIVVDKQLTRLKRHLLELYRRSQDVLAYWQH